MAETNTAFMLKADQEIDIQMDIISKAMQEYIEGNEGLDGFDPLISTSTHAIIGSKVINNLIQQTTTSEEHMTSRQNVEKLSLFLSDTLEQYKGEAHILEMVQSLLALASSLSLSFAEDYYEQNAELENATTTEAE